MRRLLTAILFPLLFVATALAQAPPHNTVTATVTDPAGHILAYAQYTVQLVDINGTPLQQASYLNQSIFPMHFEGALDGSASLSLSLIPNSVIVANKVAGASRWKFTISAPNDDSVLTSRQAWNITYMANITADTDLSTQISALSRPIAYMNIRTNQSTIAVTPTAPGTTGQVQTTNGSGVQQASGLTADTAGNAGLLSVNQSYYASRYAGGTATTKIAATLADTTICPLATGCLVMVDPSYANTEFPWSSNIGYPRGPTTSKSHLVDSRKGSQIDFYHDSPQSNFDTLWPSHMTVCSQTSWPGWTVGTGTTAQCEHEYGFYSGPGYYYGNPVLSGPVSWSVHQIHGINGSFNSLGIDQDLGLGLSKSSPGDVDAVQIYATTKGGIIAAADEGMHIFGSLSGESNFAYAGSINTGGGGSGATTLTTTATADKGGLGQGLYMLDVQTAVETDTATAMTAAAGETPGTFTVNGTAPVSTMIGTLSANVATPQSSVIGTGTTAMTFNITVQQGTPVAGDEVCFGGMFHEQAKLTSATFVSGTTWTLVAPLRHAHNSTSKIASNGPCGTFLDFTANHATPQGQVLRWPVDIIAAPDANTLWFRYFAYSSGSFVAEGPANFGAVYFATAAATSLTNVNGTVQMTMPAYSQQNTPIYWNLASITISGSTDTAFNGPCTNTTVVIGVPGLLRCTQASSVGHTSTNATVAVANGQFNTYCGAEVTDAQDESLALPIINGKFNVEPNSCPWANGDLVEQPHHYSEKIDVLHSNTNIYNPLATEFCLLCQTGYGDAMQNGNQSSDNNFSILSLGNGNSTTHYRYHGGTLIPPGGIHLGGNGGGVGGLFNFGLSMLYAPDPTGASVVYVGPPLSGVTDCSINYLPFNLVGSGGNGGQKYTPCGNETTTTGNWKLSGTVAAFNMGDRLTFTNLATPVNSTFVTATTGGQIAASTSLCARIVAKTANGNTLPSTETCLSTGAGTATNTMLYRWSYVPGATGYLVYCRTTGAEQLCANLNGSTYLAWLDDGSVTPSGAMPVANTTLGSVDNAAHVSYASGTTGFVDTVSANASLGASIAHTLPAAAGTLALNTAFVASGASHASGLVPDPGVTAGTTHFLREDATWVVPTGGGFPVQVAHASLTGQTTALTGVVSYTPTVDGTYRVTMTYIDTVACTSGTLSLAMNTVPVSGHTASPTNLTVVCATQWSSGSLSYTGHSIAGTAIGNNVLFSSVVGTPSYNIDVVIEQLQ